MDELLVISDLDGTLLGDDAALVDLARWLLTLDRQVRLAYSSGRFIPSMLESIRSTALPYPVALIGGVGTQVVLCPQSEALDWPRVRDWSASQVLTALQGVRGLAPQSPEFQSPLKVSYFLHDAEAAQLHDVRCRLARAGVRAELVYSSARDLDVLPAGVNKGAAAAYLATRLGHVQQDVVVCGDSANDLAMFQQGFRGIVVGNGHDELKQAACGHVYRARGHFAAGVREGIEYWLAQPAARGELCCGDAG